MPMQGTFNARSVAPQQGSGPHPVGNKFPFKITATEVKDVAGKQNKRFEIELSSEHGSIKHNYNLWNDNATAVKIAAGELSALCHAVNIFDIDFSNDGKALIGGVGLMDVGFQKGQEPSAEKPAGGYVELKKVYDKNGNEPGTRAAPPANAPQAQSGFAATPNVAPQQQAPQTQAPQQAANWGNGAATPNVAPQQPAQNQAWSAGEGQPASTKAPWG